MLQGRPLYDNPADAKYYVEQPEWDAVIRAVERGNNTMIRGERAVGKTSLLRQVHLTLRKHDERVVYVDAAAVAAPLELVFRVRDALKGRPGIEEAGPDTVSRAVAQVGGDQTPPPGGASRLLYDTLVGLGQAVEPTTVLLDAGTAAQALYGVFGRMRDTIWQPPHRWVAAIDNDDLATALKPPADAFFDTVIELAPLSIEQLALKCGSVTLRTGQFGLWYRGLRAAGARKHEHDAVDVEPGRRLGGPRIHLRLAAVALRGIADTIGDCIGLVVDDHEPVALAVEQIHAAEGERAVRAGGAEGHLAPAGA
jgi:hypothetical protein